MFRDFLNNCKKEHKKNLELKNRWVKVKDNLKKKKERSWNLVCRIFYLN